MLIYTKLHEHSLTPCTLFQIKTLNTIQIANMSNKRDFIRKIKHLNLIIFNEYKDYVKASGQWVINKLHVRFTLNLSKI